MILLDTNVVSETMRADPDVRIIHWMDRQLASRLFLSAISVDEIVFGIEVLPPGRRKTRLAEVFLAITGAFDGRILSLDRKAARESAVFRANRQRIGRPMSLADSQIAGIAKSNDLSLATLNTLDFEHIDLVLRQPLILASARPQTSSPLGGAAKA